MGWQWSMVFVVAVSGVALSPQGMAREIVFTTLGVFAHA